MMDRKNCEETIDNKLLPNRAKFPRQPLYTYSERGMG